VSWTLLYLVLSTMMFLEFAVRGTWAPVLSARLLGPLGMTGKQVGWIYGLVPLASIVAPLAVGAMADRWLATEWVLAGAHLISGVALIVATWIHRFPRLLGVMAIHALCFAPTVALVNSLAFTHLANPETEFFRVRVWGSIGWVLAGWALALWRRSGGEMKGGSDALLLAGILSLAMAAFSAFCLPHTPPSAGRPPWTEGLEMLKEPKVLTFLIISFVATTQLQFYYMGTARFLEDLGFRTSSVPAIMTVAQLAEILAMAQVLPYVLPKLGYQITLTIGVVLWVLMYAVYLAGRPRWLVVASMGLHGFAFAFFLDAAVIYVNAIAPSQLRGSAQSLYAVVTLGFGLFVGTQFTGWVLDRLRKDAGYQWRVIFAIPCAILTLCALAFVLFFED
jgi:nucleoside transporter